MFLKRIEVSGFKSFADKSIIVFENEVTGIVGPNGCGKSNISDAIRWVLGEQSAKSLRGNNMSDVIFAGSERRRPLSKAEVTLVFDNSRKLLPIEFDEVEITRIIYRNNSEAEYLLNKTPCRLKDITNLIMDTGLGKDSLSIISQGNIQSFAEAKPEDRRGIFEEAAGVSKYKKRKFESLSKLEKTNLNLSRIDDIILELEKQIGPLKRQAQKCEKFKELKERLEAVEVAVIVDEVTNQKEQLENMIKTLADFADDKQHNDVLIGKYEAQQADLKAEMTLSDREANQMQQQLQTLINEIQVLEKRRYEIEEKRNNWLANHEEMSAERLNQMRSMCEEARIDYEDRQNRMNTLIKDIEELRKNIDSKEDMLRHAQNEFQKASDKFNRTNSRKEVLSELINRPLMNQAGVRAIMNARKSLVGIEGVVVDLVKPEEGYESAISTALGGALYNIVTKNSECVIAAIEFLKRNESGRATFLPITALQPRVMNQEHAIAAKSIDGYLGVASDHASVSEEYDIVVKSLLGQVIVCRDLKAANEVSRILKYGYKVVTLDGDVFNKGGSITGGKAKNQESTMVQRKELEVVMANLETYRGEVDTWTSQVSLLSRDISIGKNNLADLQISMASLQPILDVKKEKYEKQCDVLKELGHLANKDNEPTEDNSLLVELNKAYAARDRLNNEIKSKHERRMSLINEEEKLANEIRELRHGLRGSNEQILSIEKSKARIETQLENALERLTSEYKMTFDYASEHCDTNINILEAKQEVELLRQQVASLGNINMEAPEQYAEVDERYTTYTTSKKELEDARDKILNAISEMDEVMISDFKQTFDAINHELDGIFKALFGGGRAKLILCDPDNILESGIEIDMQPPGKNVQNTRQFSGGEKSLFALAVLFTIMKCRSVPLCILDEVEAALDPANVERFARFLKEFNQTQFIVVTHRPGTMAQCDVLYGVTMQQKGVSQMLRVKLSEAVNMSEKDEVK